MLTNSNFVNSTFLGAFTFFMSQCIFSNVNFTAQSLVNIGSFYNNYPAYTGLFGLSFFKCNFTNSQMISKSNSSLNLVLDI